MSQFQDYMNLPEQVDEYKTLPAQDFKMPMVDYSNVMMNNFAMNPPSPPGSPMVSISSPMGSILSDMPMMRPRSDSLASWSSNLSMNSMNYMPTPQERIAQRSMSLPMIMQPMMTFDSNFNSLFPIEESSMYSNVSMAMDGKGSDKQFRCTHPGCDRVFSRIQNLRSHSRCHLATTPHVCKNCGMGFRRTTDLQRHIRTMHTPNDQKPWACNKCAKRFGRSDALKRHMASRSKEHGCPGGPNLELIAKMEEAKKKREAKQLAKALAAST